MNIFSVDYKGTMFDYPLYYDSDESYKQNQKNGYYDFFDDINTINLESFKTEIDNLLGITDFSEVKCDYEIYTLLRKYKFEIKNQIGGIIEEDDGKVIFKHLLMYLESKETNVIENEHNLFFNTINKFRKVNITEIIDLGKLIGFLELKGISDKNGEEKNRKFSNIVLQFLKNKEKVLDYIFSDINFLSKLTELLELNYKKEDNKKLIVEIKGKCIKSDKSFFEAMSIFLDSRYFKDINVSQRKNKGSDIYDKGDKIEKIIFFYESRFKEEIGEYFFNDLKNLNIQEKYKNKLRFLLNYVSKNTEKTMSILDFIKAGHINKLYLILSDEKISEKIKNFILDGNHILITTEDIIDSFYYFKDNDLLRFIKTNLNNKNIIEGLVYDKATKSRLERENKMWEDLENIPEQAYKDAMETLNMAE